MNILFIEDEPALLAAGVEQLEIMGHTVYPAINLELARAILKNPVKKVQMVIADHALPDGRGVDFVVQLKEERPEIYATIVSGCLTEKDVAILEFFEIRYHMKPLLYRKVLEEAKRERMNRSPVAKSKSKPEPDCSEELLDGDPVEGSDRSGKDSRKSKMKSNGEAKGRWAGLFGLQSRIAD